MEIISTVISGALRHKDSMGNGSVIRPGDVQVMSAGSGVRHSEYNDSASDPVHFLQIWLMPDADGLAPRYQQKAFPTAEKAGKLRLVASPDGRDGSLEVRVDAELYATRLEAGQSVTHALRPGRLAWAQIVEGGATVNGAAVSAGDGVAIEAADQVTIAARAEGTEALLFDLPE
jgi:redox-sensitive bicupin YhaK (pirin superfamily)